MKEERLAEGGKANEMGGRPLEVGVISWSWLSILSLSEYDDPRRNLVDG